MRTPFITGGTAVGSSALKRAWRPFMPMPLAASRMPSSTSAMPT